MEKIEIKSKNPNLSISIGMDDLCNVFVRLPMDQRIHIINYILEYHGGKESPLKALAEQRYKDAAKEVKVFKDLAANPNPIMANSSGAYYNVAKKYEKEANIWKQLFDLENENK